MFSSKQTSGLAQQLFWKPYIRSGVAGQQTPARCDNLLHSCLMAGWGILGLDVGFSLTIQVEAMADSDGERFGRQQPKCCRFSLLRAIEFSSRGVCRGENIQCSRVLASGEADRAFGGIDSLSNVSTRRIRAGGQNPGYTG